MLVSCACTNVSSPKLLLPESKSRSNTTSALELVLTPSSCRPSAVTAISRMPESPTTPFSPETTRSRQVNEPSAEFRSKRAIAWSNVPAT